MYPWAVDSDEALDLGFAAENVVMITPAVTMKTDKTWIVVYLGRSLKIRLL